MTTVLIVAVATLAVTLMLCFTALRAWNGWIELRRLEIAQREMVREDGEAEVGLRIELAGVKERLKKLEAIASGVDI